MSRENFYSPFEVGMLVYDLRQGEGEVIEMVEHRNRPVLVLFENGFHDYYFADGRNYEEDNLPLLYPEKVKVVPIG